MRAFSACLSVILGMSVCYLAACSSDSDAGGGAAGEAGETSTAGSSGSPAAGAPGAAGDTTGAAGAAGAPASTCAFDSDACTSCLSSKCLTELTACSKATDCNGALSALEPCACGGDMTPVQCETAFTADGGDAATPLVMCFNTNCASVCAM